MSRLVTSDYCFMSNMIMGNIRVAYTVSTEKPEGKRYLERERLMYIKVKCTLLQALMLCTGRTAHRGSRGMAMLLTTALEGGEGSASSPGRSLPPGKTRYPLYTGLGGPQGRSGQVQKISPPPEFDPRTVQPVASRYTD